MVQRCSLHLCRISTVKQCPQVLMGIIIYNSESSKAPGISLQGWIQVFGFELYAPSLICLRPSLKPPAWPD